MIELKNITVKEKDKIILNNLSLKIKENNHLLIDGKSGSGKSTFLKTLLFFSKIVEGEILFKEQKVNLQNIDDYRNNFGYIGQQKIIFNENVEAFFKEPFTYKRNRHLNYQESVVKDFFRLLNLKESLLSSKFSILSEGEKQRVHLINILLLKRKILLLDEISSALDKKSKFKVLDLLFSLPDVTIIAVSHDDDFRSCFQSKFLIKG